MRRGSPHLEADAGPLCQLCHVRDVCVVGHLRLIGVNVIQLNAVGREPLQHNVKQLAVLLLRAGRGRVR